MTIDLKWGLPFVLPFALLVLARLLWWMAGAPWSDPSTAAGLSMFTGLCTGFIAVGLMEDDGKKWTVKIGGSSND